MFEKIKGKIADTKLEIQHKREELARIARERAEFEARIERERIRAEKDALMSLNEKELMVEAIMALRGYNTRLVIIEARQNNFDDRTATLESDVRSLKSDISIIKNSGEKY